MRAKILYLDPPWSYPNNQNDQRTGDFHKYPKLTLDELKRLPVSDLLDPSGLLFSWYTGPIADSCGELMRAWKMEVINWFCFVWVKLNRNTQAHVDRINNVWTFDGGFFGYGAGGYTVTNVEAVLVARPKKSRPPVERVDAKQRQLIFAPVGNRSRKPEEVRRRIEKMYGMQERKITGVELFATRRSPGWISLGNEIDGCDIRDSLPRLLELHAAPYEAAELLSFGGTPTSAPES